MEEDQNESRDNPSRVKDITILNRLGIHARPAAMIAKCASHYKSDIRMQKDGLDVNGKSIMGIMMLAAAQGNVIRIQAQGADAAEALDAIEQLIRDRFGEE